MNGLLELFALIIVGYVVVQMVSNPKAALITIVVSAALIFAMINLPAAIGDILVWLGSAFYHVVIGLSYVLMAALVIGIPTMAIIEFIQKRK